jgi:fatty acid desaturase
LRIFSFWGLIIRSKEKVFPSESIFLLFSFSRKLIFLYMQLFRYKQDRLPVLFITLLFLLDLLVYFFASNIFFITAWTLFVTVPKICICSWNHHHQHLATFFQTPLNRLLEVIYAFHTGITTNAWVLHHVLGHHINYLDQEKDESGWLRPDGSKMGIFEYTITIAVTGYIRAYRVGKKHPKYQKSFISVGICIFLLLSLLVYFNPINALFVFVLPMMFGYLFTCWHTYSHHAGLESDNPYEASHNIMHHWYNVLTGNLGYHTAHHIKPGLHWSLLPEYHASIAHKIPVELYSRAFFPLNLLPDKNIS